MKNLYLTAFRKIRVAGVMSLLITGLAASAQSDYYESTSQGYFTATYRTKAGIVGAGNFGSDILLLGASGSKVLVSGPGAGQFITQSPDGKYIGFKSIDIDANQAPALLDVETGDVTLLEPYTNQCGQISFAADGTMAYTVGERLYIRRGDKTETYDLGLYTNIADISSDGSKVVYNDVEGNCYVIDLVTRDIIRQPVADVCIPSWSPDGGKLAVRKITGHLSAVELSTGEVYDLGSVNSFAWSSNSEDIIVSRPKRISDLAVEGATVESINFKGTQTETIVSLTDANPVTVTVSGDELLVAYAGGDRRVESIDISSGWAKADRRKARLFSAKEGEKISKPWGGTFGNAKRSDINEESLMRRVKSGAPKGENSIGLLDIPYINQLWDTPLIGGGQNSFANVNYGYNCCAATTSCMLLGYYGLLPDDPSRYVSNPGKPAGAVQVTKYAWYVAKEYTSPQTGYTFSESIDDGGYWGMTYGIKGGHAFMWYGTKQPRTAMPDFHINNGAESSSYESGNAALVRECKANRPYALCLANGTGGHLVLCFRANQIAKVDGSETYDKYGSFICHDPAGDYAKGYWSTGNWDGRFMSYDLPGFNNGNMNIGTFHWGCVTKSSNTGVTEISADNTLRVSAEPGRIVVEGEYDKLDVYDLQGRTVPELSVSPGVYLVVADGNSYKVAVP